jgi:hypothetical protein
MAIIPKSEGIHSLMQRGKIGNYSFYGLVSYGISLYGVSCSCAGIYQMRTCILGNPTAGTKRKYKKLPIKMKFYKPVFEPSEACLATRTAFANGATAWNSLTSEQQAVYTERVKGKSLTGYNLFIKEYLLSI